MYEYIYEELSSPSLYLSDDLSVYIMRESLPLHLLQITCLCSLEVSVTVWSDRLSYIYMNHLVLTHS